METGSRMTAIVMTGHGDVEQAKEAFHAHAVGLPGKPIDQAKLIIAIEKAFVRQTYAQDEEIQLAEFDHLLARLTTRLPAGERYRHTTR